MTLGEMAMTIQDAVSQGLVAAKVSGAGPGVTSRINVDLSLSSAAAGPVNVNIPRGTMFFPLDSAFQAHPTTQEKNVIVPASSHVVVEIPTICGDAFGKKPAPVDGSVGYYVGGTSPFFLHVFDTVQNNTDQLTQFAGRLGMPPQLYIDTVLQWTTWNLFGNPPFAPALDPATNEPYCNFCGNFLGATDQICNRCGQPFDINLVGGKLVIDGGGPQTGQDGGSTGNSWTNLTGGGMPDDGKDGGPGTVSLTDLRTRLGGTPPFDINTGISILKPQLSSRGADDNTIKTVAGGLFDGVDFTVKTLDQQINAVLDQRLGSLPLMGDIDPGPAPAPLPPRDTPLPFRDQASGLMMEYHGSGPNQYHPVGWHFLIGDGKWHPPKNWRHDPATGIWWITENGRPVAPAFWVKLQTKGGYKYFPPDGFKGNLTKAVTNIQAAYSLQHSAKTMGQSIDNIADSSVWITNEWFWKKTGYELWNTFSGGTLETVEKQENLGTWQGWTDAGGTGLWNFGNLASMGLANNVWNAQIKNWPTIAKDLNVLNDPDASDTDRAQAVAEIFATVMESLGEAALQTAIDLTPKAEIEVMLDPNATTEQKTKAAFTAISKVAMLIAMIAGLKGGGPKGGRAPEGAGAVERPVVDVAGEGPVAERPTVETGTGEPQAAGPKEGTWDNPDMQPASEQDAINKYNDYMKSEQTVEAARNFEQQMELAREEGVPGIEDKAAGFDPNDRPIQNQMKALDVLEARLEHQGYDTHMPGDKFNQVQEQYTRSQNEGLSRQDITDLQANVDANPNYFDDLPKQGHITDMTGEAVEPRRPNAPGRLHPGP